MTRSFLGPAWNRIIAGNIGCHAVHHRYPGIPWFALGEVQERFGVDVAGQTSATVVEAFRQICAGRQTLRSASPGAGGL
jgi:fatty acid desaturase